MNYATGESRMAHSTGEFHLFYLKWIIGGEFKTWNPPRIDLRRLRELNPAGSLALPKSILGKGTRYRAVSSGKIRMGFCDKE
jgi:hypothetical protein